MKHNVGRLDRMMRSVGGGAMTVGALVAPLDLGVRAGLGVMGSYLLWTALAGTCLGYRMMGRSTCPTGRR